MTKGEVGKPVGIIEEGPLRLEDPRAGAQRLGLPHGRGDGAVEPLGAVFHAVEGKPAEQGERESGEGGKTDHEDISSG
jgi:hypothetical protein